MTAPAHVAVSRPASERQPCAPEAGGGAPPGGSAWLAFPHGSRGGGDFGPARVRSGPGMEPARQAVDEAAAPGLAPTGYADG